MALLLSLAAQSLRILPSSRAPAVRMLAAGFSGPRQARIEQQLADAFAPAHLEVLNTSHGRKEDESHFKVGVTMPRDLHVDTQFQAQTPQEMLNQIEEEALV